MYGAATSECSGRTMVLSLQWTIQAVRRPQQSAAKYENITPYSGDVYQSGGVRMLRPLPSVATTAKQTINCALTTRICVAAAVKPPAKCTLLRTPLSHH